MSQPVVCVIAMFKANPGKEEQLKQVLSALVEPTRAEDGCITYGPMQNNKDAADFLFYEEWRDMAALGAHAKSEHLTQGREAMAGLLADPPDIRLYTKIA